MRTWRTNIGLRLSQEVGAWFEEKCDQENRAMANYIEYLVMQEFKKELESESPAGGK